MCSLPLTLICSPSLTLPCSPPLSGVFTITHSAALTTTHAGALQETALLEVQLEEATNPLKMKEMIENEKRTLELQKVQHKADFASTKLKDANNNITSLEKKLWVPLLDSPLAALHLL